MPTLWKKNIYSYTNERMERRYVYRRYFGLMLLFGFPQETQLDKISPTVLVILIISMASPSRDAFLCLCVPVLSASFPRSLQQGPKGAQRMMKGCSKVAYAFVTLLKNYSSAANTFTAQSSFEIFCKFTTFF